LAAIAYAPRPSRHALSRDGSVRFRFDDNLNRSVAELFSIRGHDMAMVCDQKLGGALDG